MEPLFEGLTASEIDYLKYLQKRGYFDGIEMFINLDTSADYRFDKFVDGGYIEVQNSGPYNGSRYIKVTEKGIAAIVDFEKFNKTHQRSKLSENIKWLIGTLLTFVGVILTYLQLTQ